MTKPNLPHINAVTCAKVGRFWAVKTDGKLLAIVLYKQGAYAIRELVERLAGLPVTTEPETEAKTAKPAKAKPGAKGDGKSKPITKAKPPQKKAEAGKPSEASAHAPAAQ